MAKKSVDGLKRLGTTVKVLLPVLVFIGMVGTGYLWLFSTFATAGDVQQIRKEVQTGSVEVKLLILEGRREQLVRERLVLEGKSVNSSDRQRLGLLKDQIDRLDKQIDALIQLQTELQKK